MTPSIRPNALIAAGLMAITICVLHVGVGAQDGPGWQFESVAAVHTDGCMFGATLAGFEYDPSGRPVLAWREENGCGAATHAFWTRKDGGVWATHAFQSEHRGGGTDVYHQMILRPSDGNPFLLFRDRDDFNNLNTYLTDLGAFPNGGTSDYLENLVGPQQCASPNYSLAFASGAGRPDWATGLALCNGTGPLRIDGTFVADASGARPALAITPDGTRHMIWSSDNFIYYTRWAPGEPAPTTQASPLFSNVNRNGGEVTLASDANGVLHAVIRGVEGDQADWDLGATVYMTSTDNGQTWSPFEYIDPDDDATPGSIGVNANISLALDANGGPAVTYWRYNSELWYARRDGAGGTWTRSLVTIMPNQRGPRATQVRFDAAGVPTIAFYDDVAQAVQLARPLPAGTTLPIDISVSGSAAPATITPGGDLTYALTVTNHGAANVDHVVLTNQLPPGATFVNASPASDASQRWPIGLLTAHGSTTIIVHAKAPNATGDAVDIASVTSDGPDTVPANNVAAIGATVCTDACGGPATNGLDVAASVSVMPNPVIGNGALTFVARMTNVGTVDAASVTLVNTLPAGVILVDVAPAVSSLAGSDQTFTVDRLPVGASAFFVIHALAPVSEGVIVDRVHVSTAGDVNSANDFASTTTTVKADACFVPPSGLVAHWRADGNALDEVGGHNGDMQGSRTFSLGHAGQAFSFDGTNDSVSIPNAPELRSNTFTVSAWVYPTDLRPGGWNVVMSGGATMWLGFTRGQPILYTQQFNEYTLSPTALPVNQWYQLTGTFDGAVVRLYVNGVEVAETADSGPMNFDSTTPFGIGTYYYQGQVYTPETFEGLIDEVTLHDRALSAAEVRGLYDGSSPCASAASTPIRNGDPETALQFNSVGMILASPTHAACTATLVSRFVVLTSAQCFQDDSPNPVFEFSLGAGRTARLTDIRQHPLFNTPEGMSRAYDVALAKLDASAANEWTDIVLPALPALSDSAPSLPLNGTAVGFGQIDAVSGQAMRTSGVLLATQYVVDYDIHFNVVPQAYIEVEPGSARDQMFCQPGAGGPLFVQDRIAGIASFRNVTTCAEDGPGYYLSVNRLADWILATSGELANHPPTITYPGPQTNAFGTQVTLPISATDPDGDTLTYAAFGLPPGLSMRQFSGVITGVPTTAGWFLSLVTVSDRYNGFVSASFSWTVTDTIVSRATTLTLSSSASPAPSGAAVTFTAAVVPVPPGGATASGNVAFINVGSNVTLATVALDSTGTATMTTSALPEGTFDIQAVYAGTPSFAGSSATITQAIQPAASTPIRNGDPETALQFNGVGMILANSTHGACNATLVSRFVVLTTAQCLDDNSPNPVFEFSLGGGRTARLTDIRLHPLFQTFEGTNRAYDVALAKLDASVANEWTDIVLPPLSDSGPVLPLNGTAVGFGQIDAVSGAVMRTSGVLLLAQYVPDFDLDFNLVDRAYIEVEPGSARDQMFCPPGVGGPLFVQDRIAGLASFRNVMTCAEPGPGYYINLNNFADWIRTTLAELTNHPPTITNPGPQTNAEGAQVTLPINATDPDADTLTYAAFGLPPGLSMGQFSGVITGVPTTAGTFLTLVTASDRYNGAVSVSFSWTIVDTTPPALTVPANITVSATTSAGAIVSFSASAIDRVDPAPTVNCTPPSGSLFPVGTTTVSCTAADHTGNVSPQQTFLVTVTFTPLVTISINDVTASEGNSGTTAFAFAVRLSSSSAQTITVHYATADGTATTADNDYAAASGTLTFAPGQTAQTIVVNVVGDTKVEPTETFTVSLSAPVNATIATGTGIGTIQNDDVHLAPTIVNPGNQSNDEGTVISLAIAAASPNHLPLTFSAVGLAPGLAINAAGVISGTLPFTSAGSYSVTVSVSDGSLSASQTFGWSVRNMNGPPVVTMANQTSYLGDAVHLQIAAVDPDGDPLSFNVAFDALRRQIPNLFLDSTTGMISGTLIQAGVFTISLAVSDSHHAAVPVTFTWTVLDHRRPTIHSAPDQTSVAGVPDSLQIHAETVPAGGTLTYSASGLPAGLSINPATGLISGTPTLANTTIAPATVTVTVRDGAGATASDTLTWRIVDPNGADLAVTATVISGSNTVLRIRVVNKGPQRVYELSPAVVKIWVPERWRDMTWICDGSLNSPSPVKGVFQVSKSAGYLALKVWLPANDSVNCSADQLDGQRPVDLVAVLISPDSPADPYLGNNIAVVRDPAGASSDSNHTPVLTNPGDQENPEGEDVTLDLTATDADGDALAYLLSGTLPAGLHLDETTGHINGVLADVSAGDYPLTVAVTDGTSVVFQSFTWHVDTRTITLENPGPQRSGVGFAVHLDLQVADRAGHPISITQTGLPAGLSIRSSSDGLAWWIDGHPDASALGSHTVTLTASSGGLPISRTFGWEVVADVPPTLDPIGDQTSIVGLPVSVQLHAQDPGGGVITYGATSLHPLPPGLRFSSTQPGLIIGAPTMAGDYTVWATATARGDEVSQAFSWTVNINHPPGVVIPGDQVTAVGQQLRTSHPLVISALDVDPGDRVVSFQVVGLPAGLTYDTTTGAVTGRTTVAGAYTVTATAVDVVGNITSRVFLWLVAEPWEADLSVSALLLPAETGILHAIVTVTNHGPAPSVTIGPTGRPSMVHISVPAAWDHVTWDCREEPFPTAHVDLFPDGRTGSVDVNVELAATGKLICEVAGPSDPPNGLRVDVVASVATPLGGRLSDPYLLNNLATARYPAATAATPNHAPVFTNPGDQQSATSDLASLALSAADADGDLLSFGVVVGVLPKGLVLDAGTGVISGTPLTTSVGDYPLTLAVTDGTAVALQSFGWRVFAPAVTLVNPGNQFGIVDHTIHLAIDVSSPTAGPIAMTASGLPNGLTLQSTSDRRTWWIGGMPAVSAIGTHSVTLTASKDGLTVSQIFPFLIVQDYPPFLDNPGGQLNAVGQDANLQLHATDANSQDTIVYGVGPLTPLPDGLSLNSATGLISGTFRAAALHQVVIVTATSNGKVASQSFVWVVRLNHPPSLTNPGNQYSLELADVSLQLNASDADGDKLTFGVDPAHPLPVGLSLDSGTGLITGQPHAGVRTVGVWVEDEWGVGASQTFTWTVEHKPIVQNPGDQIAVVGTALNLRIDISDPDPNDTLTVAVNTLFSRGGALPPGLSWREVATPGHGNSPRYRTVIFSGTPTTAGRWTTNVTATDNHGATTTISFVWLIMLPGQADLQVSGTASGSGDKVTFTVVVENRGVGNVSTGTLVIAEPANLHQTGSGAPVPVSWSCSAVQRMDFGLASVPISASVSWSEDRTMSSVILSNLHLHAGYGVRCQTEALVSNAATFTGASVAVTATASAPNDPDLSNNTAVVVYNR